MEDVIPKWQEARFEVGQQKYKDAYLDRYNGVDILEELLDARNILRLALHRIAEQNGGEVPMQVACIAKSLDYVIEDAIAHVFEMDEWLKDEWCTDGNGGKRIWWPDGVRSAR